MRRLPECCILPRVVNGELVVCLELEGATFNLIPPVAQTIGEVLVAVAQEAEKVFRPTQQPGVA